MADWLNNVMSHTEQMLNNIDRAAATKLAERGERHGSSIDISPSSDVPEITTSVSSSISDTGKPGLSCSTRVLCVPIKLMIPRFERYSYCDYTNVTQELFQVTSLPQEPMHSRTWVKVQSTLPPKIGKV